MFSKVTLGNAQACRTESEISDENRNVVALVYESLDGWHVEVLREIRLEELDEFNTMVEKAKHDLLHYVNRAGANPPEGLTSAGLSLWLMQKDDGTALGMNLSDLQKKLNDSDHS